MVQYDRTEGGSEWRNSFRLFQRVTWCGIRDYRITEPLEAMELLKLLANALNGGPQ